MPTTGNKSQPKNASKPSKRSAKTPATGRRVATQVSVNKDFEELFACLNTERARYLIVGGYAVAFHSRPRYTKDIDIFIDASPVNARRVWAALCRFGFTSPSLQPDDFTKPDGILVLGVAPMRVDILNSIPGVVFSQAWKAKVISKYGAAKVYFIAKKDLIRNKQLVARPQDLRDVEWLLRE